MGRRDEIAAIKEKERHLRSTVEGLKTLSWQERRLWLEAEGRKDQALALALVAEASRSLEEEGADIASGWASLAEIVMPADELELQAVTTALRGNAARARSELLEARRLFQRAYQKLGAGPPLDFLNRALVHRLHGSLLIDLRELNAAHEYVAKASKLYSRFSSYRGRAVCRIMLAMISHYRGEYATSASFHYLVLREDLTTAEHPELYLLVRLNLAANLIYLGRPRAAAEILAFDEDVHEQFGSPAHDLHRRWIEAQIQEAESLLPEAVALYEDVLESFRENRQTLRAAQTALLLVRTELRRGRPSQARKAAETAFEVFSLHEVHREALAALSMVVDAARREALTLETIDVVARGFHVIYYSTAETLAS